MRDYAVVTGAYWVFTLTDGAVRTLVLLYLAELGYGALAIASFFVAYELLGVVTNLFGGWLGARFGLKFPLGLGLALQAATCAALALGADAPTAALLLVGQGACGVAKDLVKSGAKSYVKLVVPDGDHGRLMQLVSLLTGSKNALKGVGFLLGGVLLGAIGFGPACWSLALALGLALAAALVALPPQPGRSPKSKVRGLLSPDARINRLAAARLFLFASRDAWFVLAVPVFLRAVLEWSYASVSLFLALWTIGYGAVQALAPRFLGREPGARALLVWTALPVLPLAAVAFADSRCGARSSPVRARSTASSSCAGRRATPWPSTSAATTPRTRPGGCSARSSRVRSTRPPPIRWTASWPASPQRRCSRSWPSPSASPCEPPSAAPSPRGNLCRCASRSAPSSASSS
jgi:MFS family permease